MDLELFSRSNFEGLYSVSLRLSIPSHPSSGSSPDFSVSVSAIVESSPSSLSDSVSCGGHIPDWESTPTSAETYAVAARAAQPYTSFSSARQP